MGQFALLFVEMVKFLELKNVMREKLLDVFQTALDRFQVIIVQVEMQICLQYVLFLHLLKFLSLFKQLKQLLIRSQQLFFHSHQSIQ